MKAGRIRVLAAAGVRQARRTDGRVEASGVCRLQVGQQRKERERGGEQVAHGDIMSAARPHGMEKAIDWASLARGP